MKKRMRKIISFMLVVLLCVGMTACNSSKQEESSQSTEETGKAGTRTVTDVTGHTLEVPENLERVVVLSAGECEIVYALGCGDLVVGRGEYCNYPEEVEKVTAIQSGSETNIEQIIALNPQLVIMSEMDQDMEQVTALEKAGIPVCMNRGSDIEGAYASIRKFGEVLGCEENAEKLVTGMQDTFADLQEKVKGKEGASVYFEVSPLEYGLWTSGNNTYMNEIAEMLGLKNVFDDVEGWAEISEEQVIERNPDYIVTITMYFGEGQTPEEEILGRKAWQDMTAIKEGHVYNANSDQISRPGPRLADAAQMLYDFVYGK